MYKVGDIFYEDSEYSARAQFCNEHGLVIVEIEPDSDGKRRFQIQEIPAPSEAEKAKYEIAELKRKLSESDYQAIKYAEGEITAAQFEPVKQQRIAWRARINELQAQYGI